MDAPAASLYDDLPYRDIARLLAREQVGAVPVVDAKDHVVGVVRPNALLQALIRDDAGIRAEVEPRIEALCVPDDRDAMEVAVHDGIVELTGRVPTATMDRLVAEVEAIADVVEVKNLLTAQLVVVAQRECAQTVTAS
jgi:hypothetical protein